MDCDRNGEKKKKVKQHACLQYIILITPASSSGMIETVPFCSSILSMINIAMIDVNAIVIYTGRNRRNC